MATVKPDPVTAGTAGAAGSSPAAVAIPAPGRYGIDIGRSAIAVSGLRKAYGDKIVLDGIDLDVPAGIGFFPARPEWGG